MAEAEGIGYGQAGPGDGNDPTNSMAFLVNRMLARVVTMKVVQVRSVTLSEDDPPGPAIVDVQPLVSMIDGNNNQIEHGVVYGLPAWRMQGGGAAVIIDPVVGDIGLAVVSDRDFSKVKTTRDVAGPGSNRRFDLADGIYLGGILNMAPSAYLQIRADGTLKIVDAAGNVLETSAAGFAVTTVPGGDFTVNGISVTLHIHSGVTTGGGTSGPPVP